MKTTLRLGIGLAFGGILAAGTTIPTYFERNAGQAPQRAEFVVRSAGYAAFLTVSGAELSLQHGTQVKLLWKDANRASAIEGLAPLEARSSYFIGSDPSQWKRDIQQYGKVRYYGVYPGIDVTFYANGNGLEQDFVVAPGADPGKILLTFDGVRGVRLDASGDLLLDTPEGAIRQKKPAIYQGDKEPISGGWALVGNREARFEIGPYDHSKPLTIDPIISFTTSIGGGPNDSPNAIAAGSDGSIYIAGNTSSTNFPPVGGVLQPAYGGGMNDAFIVKLDFTGTRVVWATYLGGSGNDIGGAVQVDPSGNVYVAGFTSSTNFPTTSGQRNFGGGNYDAFVAKISPAGDRLLYSTYVGGNGTDLAFTMAIDAAGSAYLAGATNSTNFPVASPYLGKLAGAVNAYVAKLDPSGSSVVYGTYLGGSGQDSANAIALDSAGKIYIAGFTSSPNFPTSPDALQGALKGGNDAFLVRLDPAAGTNGLLYGTLIGGSGNDAANGLTLDNNGGLYVVGTTSSPDFPVTPGGPSYGGGTSDGFIAKFSVPAAAPQMSTAVLTDRLVPHDASQITVQYIHDTGVPGSQVFAVVFCGTTVCIFGSTPNSFPFGPYGPPLDTTHDLGFMICIDVLTGSVVYDSGFLLDPTGVTSRAVTANGCPTMYVTGRASDGTPFGMGISSPYSVSDTNDCLRSDPISTGTGELFQDFTDLALGGPLPLEFHRYYGSLIQSNNSTSALGGNWTHNFDVRLLLSAKAALVYLYKGKSMQFVLVNGSWQLLSVEKYNYQLLAGPSGGYLFLDPIENHVYTFNPAGQLTGIADRNGNTLTVTQSAAGPTMVADGLGRVLNFAYQGNNLVGVADQAGRTLSFGQSNGDLTSFTNATGKKYTYSYTGSSTRHALLLTATEPLGNTPFTQTYDRAGRVSSQTDGRGFSALLSYDQGALGRNTFTDARSNMTLYVQPDFRNPVAVTDANGKNRAATYDSQNRVTSVTDRLGNTSTFTYHAPSGKIASKTDALGNTTTYSYTAQAQSGFTFYVLSGATFADGTSRQFSYDASGNLTKATDQAGNRVSFTYNSSGQVLTVTNQAGGLTTITYNSDGTRASAKTPAGDTSTYSYDNEKRLAQLTRPDASNVAFAYDSLDNVVKVTDELGHADTGVYDDNNRLSTRADPLGKQSSLAYDADDRQKAETDRTGQTKTFAYTENGQLKTATNPAGETINYSYDSLNRVSSVVDATSKGYSFGRDAESRVTSVVDALSRKYSFTRDALGRLTQLTTPRAETYAFKYDSLGRLVTATNPLSQPATYSYDSRGILTGIALPNQISAKYQTNAFGLVTSITDPNGNIWNRTFDSTGRLTSLTDPLGRKTSLTYDSRNRIAGVAVPDAGRMVTRDAAGNVTALKYSDGTQLHYSYDADNRVVAADGLTLAYDGEGRITNSNGLVISRDPVGRVASVQYAAGKTVKYDYDNRGLLASLMDWAGGVTTFTHDAARQLVSITRPNGVTTQYTYDDDGRIGGVTETSSGKTLSSITLTRDANGKIISDNRSTPQAAVPPPGVLSLGYDAAHQIASATYDGVGRITKDALRSYTWDQASRLASYTGADGSATFTYDAHGLRTTRISSGATQNYVWNYALDLPAIATVQSGGSDSRYYVHMPDGTLFYSLEAAGNARHFYHFDEVGSTVMLTDDGGKITDSYAATPYGESVVHSGNSDNPFTWLGALGVMQEGSTGMFYMRARYYDSGSARFLSRDPIGSLDPRAINPYQYAKDSPLRNADPTGLQSTTTTFPIAPGLTATVTTTKGDLGTHYDVTLSANGKPYQRIRAFYDKQGNLLFSKTETLSMGELKVAETFVSTGATSEQLAASIHEDSDPVTALISQISEGLAAPVAQINPPLTSIATASLSYNPVCINTKPASGGETSAQMSALDSMVVSESTIGQTPAYFDFDAFDIEPLKVRTDNQLHPIPPIHSILSMSPLLFNQ